MKLNLLACYFKESDGYGHAALEILKQLLELGVDVRSHTAARVEDPDLSDEYQLYVREVLSREPEKTPTVLFFCLPPMWENFTRAYGLWPCRKIGFTMWETLRVPDSWIPGMNMVDEIWVPSPTQVETFKATGIRRQVKCAQLGISAERFPLKKRENTKPFKFLHIGEPEYRKNPDGTIKAYVKAFSGKPDKVQLIMKGPSVRSELINEDIPPGVQFTWKKWKTIGIWPHDRLVELYHDCQAFVFPTRGEGWGMLPLQAMVTGMPTVLTKFLGTEWFADYGHVVPHRLVGATGNYCPHFGEVGKWAEPDVDELADLMRLVYENFDVEADEAFRKARAVAKKFSWENCGLRILELLEEGG